MGQSYIFDWYTTRSVWPMLVFLLLTLFWWFLILASKTRNKMSQIQFLLFSCHIFPNAYVQGLLVGLKKKTFEDVILGISYLFSDIHKSTNWLVMEIIVRWSGNEKLFFGKEDLAIFRGRASELSLVQGKDTCFLFRTQYSHAHTYVETLTVQRSPHNMIPL